MVELKTLQDLSDRLAAVLPPGLGRVRDELRDNFRAVLQARLAELTLTWSPASNSTCRRALLAKSRQRLAQMEERLAALEAQQKPR